MMRHILLLDDDEAVLNALRRALRQCAPEPLSVETFTDPFDALSRCCEFDFDLIISDQCMPRMSGIDFLNALRDVAPATVRMMLSASTEFETALSAINEAQVFRYIAKPWRGEQLGEALTHGLALRDRLRRELAAGAAPSGPAPTPQELEARRLEAEEPGITSVKWGPDGSIIL